MCAASKAFNAVLGTVTSAVSSSTVGSSSKEPMKSGIEEHVMEDDVELQLCWMSMPRRASSTSEILTPPTIEIVKVMSVTSRSA